MKYILFVNGERGLFILKKLLGIKHYKLQQVIYCNIKIKKDLKKFINLKKTFFLKNVNSKISQKKLKNFNTNLFIISGYPQIFKEHILNIPNIMTINLHGGPLPKYRGGSPLNWQMINGERKIGISIIKINRKIDGGKLLEQGHFKLNRSDTIKSVHIKANNLFFNILKKTLRKILGKRKKYLYIKKKGPSFYWHQRDDHDGILDFKNKTAVEAFNFIRALTNPYPGAWIKTKIHNKHCLIRLYESSITNLKSKKNKIYYEKRKLYLACKDKVLKINKFKIIYAR